MSLSFFAILDIIAKEERLPESNVKNRSGNSCIRCLLSQQKLVSEIKRAEATAVFLTFSRVLRTVDKSCSDGYNRNEKICFDMEESIMRKNFGAKAILYPMPVLIIGTYDENGKADAMNAAWGGISEETEISICVSASHRTTANILKNKAFTFSRADEKNVAAADYVGVVSGNTEPEKTAKAGWHAVRGEHVNAPLFEELPLALECKLKSYDEETCRLVGEIVNVCADEKILDDNGKVDLSKFVPITFDPVNNTYRKIGEVVGKAFNDGLKLK